MFIKAHYSTGAVAAGFTSTTMAPETKHEPAMIAEDQVKYDHVKKKGNCFYLYVSSDK